MQMRYSLLLFDVAFWSLFCPQVLLYCAGSDASHHRAESAEHRGPAGETLCRPRLARWLSLRLSATIWRAPSSATWIQRVRALLRACCLLIRRLRFRITSASSPVFILSTTASSRIASGIPRANRPMFTRRRSPIVMAAGIAERRFGCWQSSRECGLRASSGLALRPRFRANGPRITCTSTKSSTMKSVWIRSSRG